MKQDTSEESLQEYDPTKLDEFPTSERRMGGGKSRRSPLLMTMRGGLRRRVFVILIAFSMVPATLILFLSYISASETLQGSLREESINSTQQLALELDRRVGEFGRALEAVRAEVESSEIKMLLEDFDAEAVETPLPPFLPLFAQLPRDSLIVLHDELGMLRSASWGVSVTNSPLSLVGRELEILLRENSAEIKSRLEWRGRVENSSGIENRGVLLELQHPLTRAPYLVISFPFSEQWSSLNIPKSAQSQEEEHQGTQHVFLAACIPVKDLLESSIKQFGSSVRGNYVISVGTGVVLESSRAGINPEVLNSVRLRLTTESDAANEYFMLENQNVRMAVAARPIRASGFFSESPLSKPQWYVVEVVNLQDTFIALTKLYWTLVLLGLGLMCLTLVAAFFFSSKLVQPIKNLTNGMRRYALGDLDYRVEVHTHDELENLADAANIMAESLRNSYQDLANRMLELDEKANQLSLIHSISRSINKSLDLDQLFTQIVQELMGIIHCERISLSLYNKENNTLTMDFVYPVDRDVLPQHTRVPMNSSLMGKAIIDRTITLKSTKAQGTYFEETHLYRVGVRKICIVPLMATNGPVGTLNLGAARKDAFDIREIKLLERVAEPLGLALEHGRLYKEVASFAQRLEETVDKRTRELQSAQEKLVQAERFAATGSIAAHIGHEINNPLSIIKNYLKISKMKLLKDTLSKDDPKEIREGLAIIEEEIDRIARIVSKLRQVSKPPESNAVRFKVASEIEKLFELLRSFAEKQRVQFQSSVIPYDLEVVCSADYFRQILINLIRNSIDALEQQDNPLIIVRAGIVRENPELFFVEVEDNGSGIAQEHLNSIFDPFFTTKSEGKGTGLGLSVSYGLAQSMGGTLKVRSEKGVGTTLRMELPVEHQTVEDSPKPGAFFPNRESTTGIAKRKRNIVIG
jgi:signal transduction histidine kinase